MIRTSPRADWASSPGREHFAANFPHIHDRLTRQVNGSGAREGPEAEWGTVIAALLYAACDLQQVGRTDLATDVSEELARLARMLADGPPDQGET